MLLNKILLSFSLAAFAFSGNAQTARVQVIHNCADAVADSVDVYVNGNKAITNFAFRTATGFMDLPANVVLNIGIAPKNSMSVNDTVYNLAATLDPLDTYVIVASGIVSTMGYSPAQPFGLMVYNMGREAAANSANTDVLVVHGSTDAPTVDVRAGSSVLVDDIMYGQFSNGYLSLPTSNYTISITDATGATTVQTYSAPLQTLGLQGSAITVLASGFLNTANNSNGPGFGLWVALPAGGNLVPLPVVSNVINVGKERVKVYPNPVVNELRVEGIANGSEIVITDLTGRVVNTVKSTANAGVDVSGLPSGVYLLKIGENGSAVQFVKQ